MVGLHLLVLQELLLDLSVEAVDLCVQPLLLATQILDFAPHFEDVPFQLGVLLRPDPLDGIFVQFLDVIDSLEHVGDVVDPAFLDAQFLDGDVEVDGAVVGSLDEFDELLSEDGETVVLPALP